MNIESGILITVIVALMGVISAVLTTQGTRLRNVENRLNDVQEDNRKLWWYSRQLVDYIYRYRKDGSPTIPVPPTLSEDEREE